MAKEKVVEMPVKEAEAKEPETEPEKKEEKEMKKSGKAKKIALAIGGGLLAAGGLAWAGIKYALSRQNDPELPDSCSSAGSDTEASSDVE